VQENKRLVRRYYEDAPYNPEACDEIFASSFQFHAIVHADLTPQVVVSDPESEKAFYQRRKRIWGGWRIAIEEMIAEGDRVVVRWSSRGTHQAEVHGLPPTGKEVTNSGVNIFRIEDGKIAEVWDIFDRLWLWQQLGVLPNLRDALAQARVKSLSTQGTEA
jgi:steroid delta-isomerase-like uncharacterized protein